MSGSPMSISATSGFSATDHAHGRRPVLDDGDLVALHAQQVRDELAKVGGVVARRPRAARLSCGGRVACAALDTFERSRSFGDRDAHLERRALAGAVARRVRRVPPCSSTSRLTRPRPRPRPPLPSGVVRSWTNMSKMRGNSVGGDAAAVVGDADERVVADRCPSATSISPPGSVYLIAFDSRFVTPARGASDRR